MAGTASGPDLSWCRCLWQDGSQAAAAVRCWHAVRPAHRRHRRRGQAARPASHAIKGPGRRGESLCICSINSPLNGTARGGRTLSGSARHSGSLRSAGRRGVPGEPNAHAPRCPQILGWAELEPWHRRRPAGNAISSARSSLTTARTGSGMSTSLGAAIRGPSRRERGVWRSFPGPRSPPGCPW
jgi:hypothetical protein